MKVYIDGEFYEGSNAKISVFDHGLLYGDGVFEGIRIYNNKVFRLDEHIDRIYKSAKAILLDIPVGKKEMREAVLETVRLNPDKKYIRLVITRGKGSLGLNPASCLKAGIIIIVDDVQLYSDEDYKNGIKLIISSTRRMPNGVLEPQIKSLNYLNNIMAKMEAVNAGCSEAVILNTNGLVAECTGDNLFIVENDSIVTPSAAFGALDGITKKVLIELAVARGVDVREKAITRFDLYNAEECFLTGTAAEIIPVSMIDGRRIGSRMPGSLTGDLIRSFREIVNNL